MLKKMIVERFRGFTRLEVDLPKVLLLMGPNSSGKTTALHAIRIACQVPWLVLANDAAFKLTMDRFSCDDFVVRDISQLMPIADWQALFVDQRVGQGIDFTVELFFDEQDPISSIRMVGKYARNENLKVALEIKSGALVTELAPFPPRTAEYRKRLVAFLLRHLPRAILIPPFYGVIREEEYRARSVVDTLVGSADQSHVVRNMISRLAPGQFTQLNAFLKDMVGAELVQRTQGDDLERVSPLRVTFRDSNGELEISAAGAGLINLVAIYSSLSRWQDEGQERQIIFLLDEPEAHLHPKLQSFTADRLSTVITESFGAQLVMASHSLEIINKIGERPDSAVFRTDRLNVSHGGQELFGQSSLLDDLSQWADLTPYAAINFLSSKRILFHEGKSDAAILRKCADILFRNHPQKRAAFDRWTLVQMDGRGNEKLAGLITKLIESPVFAGIDANGLMVVVQLDKDYSDDLASLSAVSGSSVPMVRNVWTRHSIESLFCDPNILFQWLRTKYPGVAPAILESAVISTNADEELNQFARSERQAALIAKIDKTKENLTETNQRSFSEVASSPEVWQRGKDRASKILHAVKDSLGVVANNMTTSMEKFVERADVDSFPAGNLDAIPPEIRTLLDWMSSR